MSSSFTDIKCSWFSLSNLSMPAVRCVLRHARRSIAWLLITLSTHSPGSYKHRLLRETLISDTHHSRSLRDSFTSQFHITGCIVLLLWNVSCFFFHFACVYDVTHWSRPDDSVNGKSAKHPTNRHAILRNCRREVWSCCFSNINAIERKNFYNEYDVCPAAQLQFDTSLVLSNFRN